MARNMLIWIAVLIVGLLILIAYPMLQGNVPPDRASGFGAAIIVPFGYFLALIGAIGLVVAWMRGRAK